jgi:uncharacterized membrane protein
MFSKARLDSLSDGIFGVAMTLLILDVRLPDDFSHRNGAELLQALAGLWPKFLPYVLSFGVLGLRGLANIEVRTRAEYFNRAYVDGRLLYHFLITCVPFWTIVVGPFGVAITPHLEQGDHLRHRQLSAMLLSLRRCWRLR